MPKFCQFKTILELCFMGFYFWVNEKSLKERSLEYFGSSEHKVLPRNKNFIDNLSYEWKSSRGR